MGALWPLAAPTARRGRLWETNIDRVTARFAGGPARSRITASAGVSGGMISRTAFEADKVVAATRVGRDGGTEAGTAVVATTTNLGMAGGLAVIARNAGESGYYFPLLNL